MPATSARRYVSIMFNDEVYKVSFFAFDKVQTIAEDESKLPNEVIVAVLGYAALYAAAPDKGRWGAADGKHVVSDEDFADLMALQGNPCRLSRAVRAENARRERRRAERASLDFLRRWNAPENEPEEG